MDESSRVLPMDEAAPSVPAPDAAPADPLWYRDALIYQLHVKAFADSNDDGIGDFRGLTAKLDYVKDLGVNVVWLMPFYPSPLKDDGYDVSDYHNVHPHYGTRQDFRHFVREAHRRGLRVITEMVVNHTSDQHAWFQAARRAPAGSPKRDYYVWSDTPDRYRGTRIIFTDTETSNWSWDPVAKAHYWHRFFSHQPDLNFDNPRVLQAIFRTMRFWLDMGVDGFRLDAIPYLCEREGTSNENLPETHAVIKRIRALLDLHYRDRVLLAEANQWPEDVREYFGEGDECHMAYHFPLMPRMYMAIAQEDRHPVVEIMQQTPEIPGTCQWAIFLRNHDELTLEMVTNRERDYMYRMYAADPRARINLGIRRRLAPLMENDRARIELMNSLLFSMPGSPILYYGDELGMGDNIFLGDRDGVRTPMQWSPDRNAGFSRADPQRLYLPPIMDAIYGYEAVNVEAQTREHSSLLNWTRRLLAVRKSTQAFGRGSLRFLKAGNRKVLAYLREHGDEVILCVANVARSAQPVELDLAAYRGRVPVEMLGRAAFPPIGERPYFVTLPAHGFYWFRLAHPTEVDAPAWHEEEVPREDLPVLVLFDGWTSFFRDRVVPWRIGFAQKVRDQLELEVAPGFLAAQRWFAGGREAIRRARLADHAPWPAGGSGWLFARFDLEGEAAPASYFVPLALAWEDQDEARVRALASAALAKVRQQAAVGVLADALADEPFSRALVMAIGSSETLETARGRLRFAPTAAFSALAGAGVAALPVARAHAQSTNTILTIGERLFLKVYRRIRAGVNPELEVGRFLAERSDFRHCVPIAGSLEYEPADGASATLAILQGYVANEGDGWAYAVGYLERYLDGARTSGTAPAPDVHGAFLALMRTLATRTAQLHGAFARKTGDPAFDPEPFDDTEVAAWRSRVREEALGSAAALAGVRSRLDGADLAAAQAFEAVHARLLEHIDSVRITPSELIKTRHHGDFHLAQVLLARNDFVITDFEGEPARPVQERRRKHTPLRDVAGMLRSFGYARASALRRAVRPGEDATPLAEHAARWEAETRAAFLAAYFETAQQAGVVPAPSAVAGALVLAEIEKALYELRYEIAHRLEWVRIPLAALAELSTRADPIVNPAANRTEERRDE